jgi:hypothetical protein
MQIDGEGGVVEPAGGLVWASPSHSPELVAMM